MKKLPFFNLYIFILFFVFQSTYSFAQTSGYKIIDSIKIGGEADWDYLSVCEPLQKLFVSQDTRVDVINLYDHSLVGKINNLNDAHGIAYVPELNKGYISDGKHNAVVIFDLKSLKVIKILKTTGSDPDAIVYDPFTKRIFTFNGHSTNATAINTKTNKIAGTVKLSGSPEFGVSDFNGRMYVNIEKKNKIDIINPKTLKVIKTWSILPCKRPSAMAIDRKNNRLFIGARNQTFAVVDANSGKVITTFPIGSGVDACCFDPETNLIFCSNKDGTMSVIKQESPDKYKFLENIHTRPRSKTMAIDHNHLIYTSAMLNTSNSGDSFGILILGRK